MGYDGCADSVPIVGWTTSPRFQTTGASVFSKAKAEISSARTTSVITVSTSGLGEDVRGRVRTHSSLAGRI